MFEGTHIEKMLGEPNLEELYGIKVAEGENLGRGEMSTIIETAVERNFDVIVDRLALLTQTPSLFIEECKKTENKRAVIYGISRTPVVDVELVPDSEKIVSPESFEKNAALSVCGMLKININESEEWHNVSGNRDRIEFEGWDTNPARQETPISPYYYVREVSEGSEVVGE